VFPDLRVKELERSFLVAGFGSEPAVATDVQAQTRVEKLTQFRDAPLRVPPVSIGVLLLNNIDRVAERNRFRKAG